MTGKNNAASRRFDHYAISSFFLRAGLGTVFLYATVASLLNPEGWVVFLPSWIGSIIPATIVLFMFSLYQTVLSLWLFSGWKTFYAAVFAAVTLLGIIVTNIYFLDIVFRDVAIFFSAIGLLMLHAKQKKRDGKNSR